MWGRLGSKYSSICCLVPQMVCPDKRSDKIERAAHTFAVLWFWLSLTVHKSLNCARFSGV